MFNVYRWLRDNENQIRFCEGDGCKWYASVDIAKLLGYSHPSKAARRMLERNVALFEGHTKLIKTVHESGLTRTNLALDEDAVEIFVRRACTARAAEARDQYYFVMN